MNFSNPTDIVECYRCKSRMIRMKTLLVDTPKGRFRLCRECYIAFEKDRAKQQYENAKENVKKFQLHVDPADVMKEKEKFLQNLKEGKI